MFSEADKVWEFPGNVGDYQVCTLNIITRYRHTFLKMCYLVGMKGYSKKILCLTSYIYARLSLGEIIVKNPFISNYIFNLYYILLYTCS